MLKPLKQWICDTCKELIERPEDGWVEWLDGEDDPLGRTFAMRICHHATTSPRRREGAHPGERGPSCYAHRGPPDLPLVNLVGDVGMARMLSFLHPGPIIDPEMSQPVRVKDFANWVDTFRRLHVPYYEEARQYFQEARNDARWAEANEVFPYKPEVLRQIIEEFGNGDR